MISYKLQIMDFLDFFEPVRIGTNINLLRRSTVLETYTNESTIDTGRVCSICQNTYVNGDIVRKINHCGHFYHHICLDQWLENNTKCPECQYDLRESQSSTSTASTTSTNHNNEQPTSLPQQTQPPPFIPRIYNSAGIPPTFNHPFNNPLLNQQQHHQQSNPYIQLAFQQRINEIIRNRLVNNASRDHHNFFAIPIFRHEREPENNEHHNILNEINELRSILTNSLNQTINGRLINSIINQNVSRTPQTNVTTSQNQSIPQNIQQIIQAISNSLSSESSDSDNPTVEVEYYYQNDNSPRIQRITQQIQRQPVTINTEISRPPPTLNIESDSESESESPPDNDKDNNHEVISIKEDNKKYKKIIKTEYILDDSIQDDNSERNNNTKTSLELIVSKINGLEKKIEDLKINEMELEKNNIKKQKCSLFSCWKKN
jgi:hypothetical protein